MSEAEKPPINTFKISKFLIEEAEPYRIDPENPNIISPVVKARIILQNGEMFGVGMGSFDVTEDSIRKLWHENQAAFSKIEVEDPKKAGREIIPSRFDIRVDNHSVINFTVAEAPKSNEELLKILKDLVVAMEVPTVADSEI